MSAEKRGTSFWECLRSNFTAVTENRIENNFPRCFKHIGYTHRAIPMTDLKLAAHKDIANE